MHEHSHNTPPHALSRSVSYAAEITLNTSTASALLTVSIPVLATRSGWSASDARWNAFLRSAADAPRGTAAPVGMRSAATTSWSVAS